MMTDKDDLGIIAKALKSYQELAYDRAKQDCESRPGLYAADAALEALARIRERIANSAPAEQAE